MDRSQLANKLNRNSRKGKTPNPLKARMNDNIAKLQKLRVDNVIIVSKDIFGNKIEIEHKFQSCMTVDSEEKLYCTSCTARMFAERSRNTLINAEALLIKEKLGKAIKRFNRHPLFDCNVMQFIFDFAS